MPVSHAVPRGSIEGAMLGASRAHLITIDYGVHAIAQFMNIFEARRF